jgi:hypothetical protein
MNEDMNGMSASGKVSDLLLLTLLADNSLGSSVGLEGCAWLLPYAGMSNMYAEKDTLTVKNLSRIRTYIADTFMTHSI